MQDQSKHDNAPIAEVLLKGSAYINRCIVSDETTFHSHNFVEIDYVADGVGKHIIGDSVYETQKGHITLINYDVPHKFTATDSELIIYNCIFTPGYFDAALTGSRNFFDVTNHFLLSNFYTQDFDSYIDVIASSSENAHVLNIFERMLQEYERKQIGYKEIMRGYLIELLVIIFRLQLHAGTNQNEKMSEVFDYINTHYTEDIRIDRLAAISQFSTSHFCRTFKSMTGTTVISYIQALRIDEACRLLRETDQNVLEIADAVGYSDIKHFYNIFKKITGKLPKDFR